MNDKCQFIIKEGLNIGLPCDKDTIGSISPQGVYEKKWCRYHPNGIIAKACREEHTSLEEELEKNPGTTLKLSKITFNVFSLMKMIFSMNCILQWITRESLPPQRARSTSSSLLKLNKILSGVSLHYPR